jgi:hypothetical protein
MSSKLSTELSSKSFSSYSSAINAKLSFFFFIFFFLLGFESRWVLVADAGLIFSA